MEKCVCCGVETNGKYGSKFPVCLDCYGSNKLADLFSSLLNKQDITNYFLENYFDLVMKEAKSWRIFKEGY